MKQLYLIILLGLLSLTLGLQAQEQTEQGEQLLVFRNTGVVDLLYTNEVDSVVTNDTTQVFYAKDTVLVVPIAELDSVAVGSRNEMKFHDGVKELTTQDDLPWIIRFDGQTICYRTNTPANILPTVGTKLFYGLHKEGATIFPVGLCGKVTAVTNTGEEIRVEIEQLQLEDIFSKLFLAGPVHEEIDVPLSRLRAMRKAPVAGNLDLKFALPIPDLGSVDVHGNASVKGNVVIKLGYKHADLDISYGFGLGVKLEAKENAEFNIEELLPEQQIGTFYGLLNIEAATGAFLDMAADLSFSMNMDRTYNKKLLWTRQKNDNTFEYKDKNKNEPYEDKVQYDLTLNGSVFFGPELRIDFVTIGDIIGARAKLKAGPELEGKLSLGMLQDMRNYKPEVYGSAQLMSRSKVAVEGYTTNRHYIAWGEVDEHKIFNVAIPFAEDTLNLFPPFSCSTATAETVKQTQEQPEPETVVNMATAVEEQVATDLEMGFDIVDPQGEIVDSVFTDTIKAEPIETMVVQTFEDKIELPKTIKQENLEGYTMRPIFHYAGYTISAAPVGIMKDVLLQPYSATQTTGAMTFIGNSPFLGSVVKDGTLYQVGLHLPVPLKNNVYQQGKDRMIIPGTPIDDNHGNLLLGTWTGTVNGEDVTLTFNEDKAGEFNKAAFAYELNNPQSGDLVLKFEDSENMVLRLLSVTEAVLKLRDKRDENHIIWTLIR